MQKHANHRMISGHRGYIPLSILLVMLASAPAASSLVFPDQSGTLTVSARHDSAALTGNGSGAKVPNKTLDALNRKVPVPGAAWIFGSGLLGLVGVVRRRRKGRPWSGDNV
jgi:hypothetical protein